MPSISTLIRDAESARNFRPEELVVPQHVGAFVMKEILLSQGRVALLDDEDFEWINSEGLWSARQQPSGLWYAVRREGREYFYMHRMIMEIAEPHGIPAREFINHKDGNGLNNQRQNLELVTLLENTRHYHRNRS